MPEFTLRTERNVFQIFAQQVEEAYDSFSRKLIIEGRRLAALGMSREQIIRTLQDDFTNDRGVFGEYLSAIKGYVKDAGNDIYHTASNEPMKDRGELFIRLLNPLDPLPDGITHCTSCPYEASLPPRTWEEIPKPKQQPTHGRSNCKRNCKCTIILADEQNLIDQQRYNTTYATLADVEAEMAA